MHDKKTSLAALLLAAIALAGCVQTAPTERSSLQEVLANLPGVYTNRAQYEAADSALKITPKVGDTRPWIDHQHAMFRRADVPAVPGNVIALEWRAGGPEGPVSRQRLWAFREGGAGVVMDFYSLKAPIDINDDDALGALTVDDLIAYGDKCSLPLRLEGEAFAFSIPDSCRITSQSGRDMILSAEIRLGDTLSYREAGRLADGTPIFEVPGGRAYEFQRLGPPHRP